MVHHDDALGRLTEGEGRLDSFAAAALKRVPFRGSAERMLTLGELCDLVAGRVTMLVELKGRFDGDDRLATRSPTCSPVTAGRWRRCRSTCADGAAAKAPDFVAASIAAEIPAAFLSGLDAGLDASRHGLSPSSGLPARHNSWLTRRRDLPAAPLVARHVIGMPLLTWTVRTEAERLAAARFADQMIFEGFRP